MALYHCDNCNFTHKSVVVMHVHYQRSHPDELVTIDKIKHLHSASHTTPEKSSNPKTVMENCTPQKNASESLEKDEAELSQQNVTLSLISPVHTPEASKTNLKSPKLQKVKSTEDSNKTRKPLSKYEEDVSTKMDSSQERMFYCQFCSYSSTKIRSVIGHHNAKHAMNGPISVEELLCYSAKMQKKKLQSDTKASGDSQTSKPVAVQSKKALEFDKNDDGDASTSRFKAYECAEKLFYCQKCNFASPTVKGVLNHQSKIHRRINSSKDCILRHTALICKEIEKSKSQTTDLSFATNLPLPILNTGDENVFFCHFCNYRHSTMDRLMRHYLKNHRGFKITSEQIYLHTSMIFEKTQLMHLKTAKCNLETPEKKEAEKKKSTKPTKCVSDSISSSAGVTQTQRDLKCHRCSFITQYLYVLRRHMWKVHKANRTSSDILRFCFKQGHISSGYYCDLCVFSDSRAEAVYKHYLEQHPERKLSFQYVSTRLYVGPDSCAPKRKKCEVKQTSVGNESKKYSCKSCSFKASSMLDFTRHYRVVHPWSVKEDGSVPGVKIRKKTCTNTQLKDEDEILKSFETYQIPLEFDKSLDLSDEEEEKESDNAFKCSFCPAIFYSQHSLSTHCGMKHQSALHEKSEQQETQIHVQVFTCTHCNYINSNYQGVLTHCQIKHPYLESGADSLHLDKVSLKNLNASLNKSSPGKSLKYRGYICKTCQHICSTVENLNKHCKKYHKKPVSNILKPAAKTPAESKINQSNTYSTQRLASKASFIRKKIRAVIHCKHCHYFCTTNIALSRHLRIQHAEPSVGELKEITYRCSLCPLLYFRKKRLGTHYMKKHGKDAYIKYFVSVHKQVPESTSADQPSTKPLKSTSEASNSGNTVEEKKLFYKCPGCPYVNASYHGTLTHCQMVHPDLLVRADKLETAEVCVDNMVKYTMGKTSKEKGYMCNKCPQIHASLVNLKIHSEKFHDHAKPSASEHLDDAATEQQPPQSFSPLKEDSAKNKKLTANATEILPSQKSGTPETSQSNAHSLQTKEAVFKCHMCNYKGSCRKYLYCHYKYTHKLDTLSMFKLLEKYNKYNRKSNKLRTAQSEESAHNKCKKCLNLTFNSSQLLIAHYSTFHQTQDFTVLSQRSNRSTGSYKCSHCMKVIYGIKNLWCHLDRHRAWRMKKAKTAETQTLSITKTTPEAKPNELQKNEQPLLDTVEELASGMMSPAENFTLPTSPLQLILKSTDLDPSELESRDHKHCCNQCRRKFMSLKGLRSHERSHAALAAIKKLDKVPPTSLKEIIDKYLVYKPGTLRPFMCSFCAYRTPVLSLLKSHLIRKHSDVLMEVAEADNLDQMSTQICGKDPPYLTREKNYSPEPNEEPEKTEKSLYLEPPAVQRQLNQYNLMAQISVSSQTKSHEPKLTEKSPLQCEFCNFNSRHLAHIRRHYLNRHGKRFLKCKNCDFFSGIRKTLEQHMKNGHSTTQSEHTQQKDLCCPFCLYQTKNKNNMIDHIVLHREERVVPIEVRRSKLSHYLQGTVFRCHKCTFTSGSAENLHLHMMKHNDIKPYKCRLCYFDCTQLSNLEAHLSDKHQVVRNHELVGQVSLDQLEATVCKMPDMQDESLSKFEQNNNDNEMFEKEMFDTASNKVPDETLANKSTEHDIGEKTAMPMMENEQGPKEQPGVVHSHDTARGQRIKNDKHARNAAVQSDEPRGPHKDSQGHSSQTCSVDRNIKLTPIKQEASERGKEPTKAQTSNIKALLEGGVLHQIPVLNEDGYKKAHQSGTVKMEQNTETEVPDSHHENKLLDDIKNQVNTIRAQESLKVEMQTQTSMPSCAHLKISHRENFDVPFVNCKEEALSLNTNESLTDPYRDMPVLEKVFLKEEMSSLRLCKEEDETCDQFKQKQNRGQKLIAKDENRCKGQEQEEGNLMKEADIQHVHREMATVGAAEVFCPSVVEKKLYTCEFCGRKLTNSHELKRHVMRHGI